MAEERRRGEEDVGPGGSYQVFVQMEELLDKLKLLHYEESFCKQLGFRSFSRHYFALATSSGEQFYYFTSIAAWLLQMAGKHFEMPQEYDDPNATISGILDECRQLNLSPDFPPSKLKSGSGEHVVWTLTNLADEALKAKAFSWGSPIYPEEEADEENIIEDDAEINFSQKQEEDEIEEDDDIEEEENIMGLEDLSKLSHKSGVDSSKPDEIMESNTDAAEWRLEVERVLPQLKIPIRTDNKDWRVHVDQMHSHKEGIENCLKETKTQLDKLHNEIHKTMEKIAAREKYMNNQMEGHLTEFRAMQDQLAETKERYKQCSGGVTEKSRELAEISEELDKIKQGMGMRGSTMTDGGPLVRIKQATTKLKSELTNMDIRIGVVQHILLQAKLKERTAQNRDIYASQDDDIGY